MDGGTLQQLRNLINRRNVSRKPGTNIDAASDFLTVVGEAHIIEATLQFLNMQNLSSNPDELLIDHSCISWPADDKRDAVMKIAVAIVEKYCDFNFFLDSPDSSESIADDEYMSMLVMHCHCACSSCSSKMQLLKQMVVESFSAGSISSYSTILQGSQTTALKP